MCGIAGIIAKTAESEEHVRALAELLGERIAHRGPDDYGCHARGPVAFLNRRLAIVDIAGGHQPIYNRDKTVGIVYNGEVYNFPELREFLIGRGHRFRTRTDTEVILALYEELGVEAFTRLEGMFACCIWDERREEVYLARDAFGMKPLYIYEDASRLVFCSELSAILALPGLDRGLDPRGIHDYLTFRYINEPYTVYQRIRRVPAGSYVRIHRNQATTWSFCDLTDLGVEQVGSFDEAKARLSDLLLRSVRAHLVGEAPIALLLSGGIDSSVIAVLLKQLGVKLEAFNVGFPSVNEFEYSGAVAQECGITLHNVEITPAEIIRRMDEVIAAVDEPLADPACFPLYLLCEHVKRFAKVVLSGEGGDELFGGYPQYRLFAEPLDERQLFQRFHEASWYFSDAHELMPGFQNASQWRRFRKYFAGPTALGAMSNYDFKTWMPEDLMMKGDKVLMRHSLEGRFPFLQRELLRFSRSLPDGFKIAPDGVTKRLLREAFRDQIPESVLNRPKMGFSVPTAEALQHLRQQVRDTCAGLRGHELAEHLDIGKAEQVFDRFYAGNAGLALKAWTLYVLLRWFALQAGEPSGVSSTGASSRGRARPGGGAAGAGAPQLLRERPCPLCGTEASRVVLEARGKDLRSALLSTQGLDPQALQDAVLTYRYCEACDFAFVSPLPDLRYVDFSHLPAEEKVRLVKNHRPGGHWMDDDGYIARKLKSTAYHYAKAGFGRRAGGGRVLDISCRTGVSLDYYHRQGWAECCGLEVDLACVERMRRRYPHIRAIWGDVHSLELAAHEGTYDLITLDNALEHHTRPVEAIRRCCELLKPGGLLWLCVPDYQGAWVQGAGAKSPNVNWGHWSFFTVRSLGLLLEHGFKDLRFYNSKMEFPWTDARRAPPRYVSEDWIQLVAVRLGS
jgi:asparagine synthase (glutamine-hydrolysing)